MISLLTGTLLWKRPPRLLLDVHGVGYELEAPMNTFYGLPDIGKQVTLHTCLLTREDAQLLFGFSDPEQQEMFRSLIKVSGIGAKTALAILSSMTAEEFRQCMLEKDVRSLTLIPTIGKKTAERLIVEMRDRMSESIMGDAADSGLAAPSRTSAPDPAKDAIRALVALGYKAAEAHKRIQGMDTAGMDCEQIIRAALRNTTA